jgi:phenylalanyl-tRNA synthetase beta chain
VPVAQPVPKHQAVERDIAVVVAESVTHAALMQAIQAAPTQGLLQQAALFDIYRPQAGAGATSALAQGEKSMAVRLYFQAAANANLTDEQVEPAVRAVVDTLATQLGARLR